jgi:hypothetical protein
LINYSISDGGTPKKKLDGRSDLTLGGTDVKTGRGKAKKWNICSKHTKVMFCITEMNSKLFYTVAKTCLVQHAQSLRRNDTVGCSIDCIVQSNKNVQRGNNELVGRNNERNRGRED